ncbi:hypothetical protein MBM_04885 [Drepanopeziza brunnea f. sp. 'multigermtubi' MB_m1]|uniref:Uncharacterized protein n=1 Tax=Marssonina brunnea f. sp. multigermtubi (strain MB_m1) TaxID=1072389 RepID=K1X991_MARBU|nr:uncharacterized protein MBM_04885 [Drepanopeziza brunnea f. sp. 'multigermtubi' MB_m1]EKD17308.1 hypothetical protein MBM_04885 [Drepanopeziza brunnea f. sp. 'multigermtubi' MB_m1]
MQKVNTRSLIQHQTWKRRFIVTFWSLLIPLLAIDIVVLGALLGIEQNGLDDPMQAVDEDTSIQAWTVINMLAAITAFLTNVVNLSMYTHSDLSPAIYVACNGAVLALWSIPFVYNIYMNTTRWADKGYNYIYVYIATGLSSVIFTTMLLSTLYAVQVFRAHQRRSRTIQEKYAAESEQAPEVFYN